MEAKVFTVENRKGGVAKTTTAVTLACGLLIIWLAAGMLPLPKRTSSAITWFTERAAEVAIFLGILRLVEIGCGIGVPWMLRVGRETFSIYIVHVIILYGGLFGLGLNRWLKDSLTPWQAAGGAAVFLALFIAQAQLLQAWKLRRRQAGRLTE